MDTQELDALPHSLEEIARAKAFSDYTALTEASVGRVYRHWLRRGHANFAIVSAHTPEQTPQENNTATDNLRKDLNQANLGYIKMSGAGQSGDGKISYEPSFFVLGMKPKLAIHLGKKYDQYSVIYAGPETNGEVHHDKLKEGTKEVWTSFHPKYLAKYFSALRKVTQAFTFDHPDSPAEGLARAPVREWIEYWPGNVGEGRWTEHLIHLYAKAKAAGRQEREPSPPALRYPDED